ncbi:MULTISPECIES: DUF3630 family protein [Corallincola]|nr:MULTISPECIES: DUF3630 family protein [Corallincola]TAA46756.1 DUF3630 family protein [Corallincola spongiicola]
MNRPIPPLWREAEQHWLYLGDVLAWELFPAWGEALCAEMGIQVIVKDSGADRHIWQCRGNGFDLLLQFEGLAETIWLEPLREADWPALQASFTE